jgi:hypothetical protein
MLKILLKAVYIDVQGFLMVRITPNSVLQAVQTGELMDKILHHIVLVNAQLIHLLII